MPPARKEISLKLFPAFVFNHIQSVLGDENVPTLLNLPTIKNQPLFVSIEVLNEDKTYRLQGCMGSVTIQYSTLWESLATFGKAAAFMDPRFPSLTRADLMRTRCTVSFLHAFRDAANAFDWVVGTHGIHLTLAHQRRRYEGTFLPHVARDCRWNQRVTVAHLLRRAGFDGFIGEELCRLVHVRAFEAMSVPLTFSEYRSLSVPK
eukprot:gnl/Chilomastix_cuspidata/3720.p2 GENE.gnl/Chilomastix_cuspidata/3720~~gnl/Chilomastix_cuspidata/3720.p2  ORF type:complete len:205 (+),score=50.39 gnl/Chilomastix_cuspidata/3720:194-808(+)